MEKDKIYELGCMILGLIVCTLCITTEPPTDSTFEEIWKYIMLIIGIIALYSLTLLGMIYGSITRRDERREKDLRPVWHYKDLDELEERIKKLEEMKE